jgi:hypothetical protein
VLAFAATLAQAAAPVGAGAAFDAFGGYNPILWGLVLVSAVASLALLPAGREAVPGVSNVDTEGAARDVIAAAPRNGHRGREAS